MKEAGLEVRLPFPPTNMSAMAIIITQITRKITPYLQDTFYGGVRFGNHNTLYGLATWTPTHDTPLSTLYITLWKPIILLERVFTVAKPRNTIIMQSLL